MFALNAYGYSALPGLPASLFETPKTQPSKPRLVTVAPASSDSVLLQIVPPIDDGGSPVTRYRVEWDAVSAEAFDSILTIPAKSLLYSPYEVQRIRTSAAAYDLSGTFAIEFGGFSTIPIPVDASAERVEAALEMLPTAGDVKVTRDDSPDTHGVDWTVTFKNADWWRGGALYDVPLMTVSNTNGGSSSSSVSALTLGSTFSGTSGSISVDSRVKAMAGFEQQLIDVAVSVGSIHGDFSLSYQGHATARLSLDSDDDAISLALSSLTGLGKAQVRRRNYVSTGEGFQLLLVFVEHLGNVETVRLDSSRLQGLDASASVTVAYTDLVVGTIPTMESAYRGEVIVSANASDSTLVVSIPGLASGVSYHMRVYPWNGVGNVYGDATGCTPATVTPTNAPLAVSGALVQPIGSNALRVSWTSPSTSGVDVSAYRVEVAAASAITEVQVVAINSSADTFAGSFCLSYQGFSTAAIPYDASASRVESALESMPGVGNVVITQSLISGSSFGISWTVQFLDNIGNVDTLEVRSHLIHTYIYMFIYI